MVTKRCLRSLVAALAIAVLIGAPALSIARAEEGRGSIVIHSRACEVDAVSLYDDCHDLGGPAGSVYTIDNRVPKAIDGNGNVSFGRATAGDHLVTLTSGYDSGAYRKIRAFCSNSATGTGPNEATILYSETPQFWVRVAPHSRLTCDVYFIP